MERAGVLVLHLFVQSVGEENNESANGRFESKVNR